jgi:alkylated DNA repair dioxygenase AlkB
MIDILTTLINCPCSLGNAAIFLIGGLTRDTEPVPILLRTGDVVIMSGPACRRAYHGLSPLIVASLIQKSPFLSRRTANPRKYTPATLRSL